MLGFHQAELACSRSGGGDGGRLFWPTTPSEEGEEEMRGIKMPHLQFVAEQIEQNFLSSKGGGGGGGEGEGERQFWVGLTPAMEEKSFIDVSVHTHHRLPELIRL